MSDVDNTAWMNTKKIIDDLYIRAPDGVGSYRLVPPSAMYHPGEAGGYTAPVYTVPAHEVLLIAIMLFKAMNNKDARPLDYWDYIERHNLQRYFVKVEEPADG